jgi:hypothetical protein
MLLVLFLIAWGASLLVKPLIPEGRIKRFLYKRHHVIPDPDNPSRQKRLRA